MAGRVLPKIVYVLTWRTLNLVVVLFRGDLVFIEHGTRRMHLGGIATNPPPAEWTVQQARNLALRLDERFEGIKFLLRDRGSNFTASFDAVFQAAGARILVSAVQAPRMNAICERLVARCAAKSSTDADPR